MEVFEQRGVELREFIDAVDAVVACTHDSGQGGGSGVDVELDHYYAGWLRGAKIGRIQNFRDRAEALRNGPAATGSG
jgi:hypothetical protein